LSLMMNITPISAAAIRITAVTILPLLIDMTSHFLSALPR
jgi:hypothetical protein